MKQQTPRSPKILTIVGLICLFVPILILGLWIHAFNLGTTQIERVEIFTSYFPGFLQDIFAITFLSMAFCILTIILSSIALKLPGKLWKAMNIVILVFSLLLLLMNLFQMM
jgi:hypothetical protein